MRLFTCRFARLFFVALAALTAISSVHQSPTVIDDRNNQTNEQDAPEIIASNTNSSKAAKNLSPQRIIFNRSTLILHVGPQKMGTTYLQNTLSRPSVGKYLEQDGYLFIGKINGIAYTYGADFFDEDGHLNPKLVNQLSEWKGRGGRHAIIVSENWHGVPVHFFRSFFQLEGWDTRVIVGYRQYFEYLPSYYNQIVKPGEFRTYTISGLWPGEKKGEEIGHHILPFDVENRSFKHFSNHFRNAARKLHHPSQNTINKFSGLNPQSLDIVQLPYLPPTASGDPYLVYVLCSLMDAPASCQAAKEGKIGVYSYYENLNES